MLIKGIEVTGAELVEALKDQANKADFDTLAGANLFKSEITAEGVESFLSTDQGQKLIQPKLDQYHTKGLNSYLEKNKDKFVTKEEHEKLLAENNSKLEESNATIKKLNIDTKFRNQLLQEGIKPEKIDFALKLTDTSKLSIDNDNLLGATDLITGLKSTVAEWFGDTAKPKGNGDAGNPPGQAAEPPTGDVGDNLQAMRAAAGLN